MSCHRLFPVCSHAVLLGLFAAMLAPPGLADDAVTNAAPAIEQDVDVEALAVHEADLDLAMPEIELFTEALLHVRKHYVNEKTYQEIVSGALHGMLGELDAHSSFLEPRDYEEMQDDTSGKFSGIGIHIGIRGGNPMVIAPIEGTPAFRAGLQSGDRILKIDGETITNLSLRDSIKRLRGETGTEVILTVQGHGDDEPREVPIVRESIIVPSVKGASLVRDNIGYVRITQFSAPTDRLLKEAIVDLMEQGMDALVLDLRGNPGGLLKSAVKVSSMFLPVGEVIVTTKGRPKVYGDRSSHSSGPLHLTEFPMAILVNGGSASASEIVAGALQDHGRAVLVGSTTFGKASVQSVIPLGQGKKEALRLTIARYYTPSGKEIHDVGIEPDISVHMKPSDWKRVQIRRSHLETPLLFEDDVKSKYKDAEDHVLNRALDVLLAVKIFK
ncbi:MAG: S41 family peptidase [Kiritimatiellae bacterium]|nr:S41 family peptidase [Kiritimatiellia bacterium]